MTTATAQAQPATNTDDPWAVHMRDGNEHAVKGLWHNALRDFDAALQHAHSAYTSNAYSDMYKKLARIILCHLSKAEILEQLGKTSQAADQLRIPFEFLNKQFLIHQDNREALQAITAYHGRLKEQCSEFLRLHPLVFHHLAENIISANLGHGSNLKH